MTADGIYIALYGYTSLYLEWMTKRFEEKLNDE
jgi:hypothetical protein